MHKGLFNNAPFGDRGSLIAPDLTMFLLSPDDRR